LGDIERETMGPIKLGKETRIVREEFESTSRERESRRSRTVKSGEERERDLCQTQTTSGGG
jgi:hypothetical protein